jgi:hypothetical protein
VLTSRQFPPLSITSHVSHIACSLSFGTKTSCHRTGHMFVLPPGAPSCLPTSKGWGDVVNQRLERPSACSLSARFHREKRPQCVRSSSSDQSRSPTVQTPLPAVLRRSQRSQRQQTPKSTRSHRVGRYLMSTRSKRHRGGMPCACGSWSSDGKDVPRGSKLYGQSDGRPPARRGCHN